MADTTVLTPGERSGDSIGPYRLLQVIGEGGFGIVWLAERREDYTQRVALKVIKPGMDSRAVVARFEQERQALAVMDHPNVARVLDGGLTPLGRPYFVMEHVQGEPITDYCDRHRLTIRQRLELFIPVCEAVQHAHMKGIIHRDLKPSNILVSITDSHAIPKVIDFGVAKAVAHTLTEKTVFTEQGQLIGTPEYMSPEQAEMGALDIDTRTDVYSLGVVLYELVAGILPFDPRTLRAAGFDAIRRIIREQDAPKPSTRLSTIDAQSAAGIAHSRQSRRDDLTTELRRELDWIPLKALRKSRTERYATPTDLARDIRRYLNNEPLEARPESAGYRLRKFIRRNRGPILAASLALAAVTGFVAAAWGLLEASQREAGERKARTAESRAKEELSSVRQTISELELQAKEIKSGSEYEMYASHILGASNTLQIADARRTREHLDACPERLRGWEWRYLDAVSDTSSFRQTIENRAFIAAALSADGRRALVLDSQVIDYEAGPPYAEPANLLSAWDIRRGEPVPVQPGDTVSKDSSASYVGGPSTVVIRAWNNGAEIASINCAPQGGAGALLIDAASRRAVIGFSWPAPTRVISLDEPASPPLLTISDGSRPELATHSSRFAAFHQGGGITVWDLKTLREVNSFPPPLVGLCLSGDGNWMLARRDGRAILFNVDSRTEIGSCDLPAPHEIPLRLNLTGSKAAVCTTPSRIDVYDVLADQQLCSLELPGAHRITEYVFVPGSARIAVIGSDLRMFQCSSRDPVWTRALPHLRSLSASLDGERLTVISGSSVLTLNAASGEIIDSRRFDPAPLACFGESDDRLVVQTPGRSLGYGDDTGVIAWVPCAGSSGIWGARPPNQHMAFVTDRDGTRGRLFDGKAGVFVYERGVNQGPVPGIVNTEPQVDQMEASGALSAAASEDGRAKHWFSMDGLHFACLHSSGTILDLLALPSAEVRRSFRFADSPAAGHALSPTAKRVATFHEDGTVRIWRTDSGSCEQVLPGDPAISGLLISDDGEAVVLIMQDDSLHVRPLDNRLATTRLAGQTLRPNSGDTVALSRDGATILAVQDNFDRDEYSIRTWPAKDPRAPRRIDPSPGARGVIYPAAFSPNGEMALYQRPDLDLVLYDIIHDRISVIQPARPMKYGIGDWFSPDSRLLLVPLGDSVRLVTLDGSPELSSRIVSQAMTEHAGWSPDGSMIAAVADRPDSMSVFRTVNFTHAFDLPPGEVRWSPESDFVASVDDNGVRVFNTRTGEEVANSPIQLNGRSMCFLPGGLLATDRGVWRTSDGAQVCEFPPPPVDGPISLCAMPDGKAVWRGVLLPENSNNRPWTYAAMMLDTQTGAVISRSFAPGVPTLVTHDGRRAFMSGEDVRVWDTATGRELLTIQAPDGANISAIHLAPGDETLRTLSNRHLLRTYSPNSALSVRPTIPSAGP